jgi:hypothetical protein
MAQDPFRRARANRALPRGISSVLQAINFIPDGDPCTSMFDLSIFLLQGHVVAVSGSPQPLLPK